MFTTYCHSHGKEEICPSDPYEVCPECFHIFHTAEALLADCNDPNKTDPTTILSCPHCNHDFL